MNKVFFLVFFFLNDISFLNGPEYNDGYKSTAPESDRKHTRLNKIHAWVAIAAVYLKQN